MGLGSTAKKVQKLADLAEQLYTKVNEMRAEVNEMRQTVAATDERVGELEGELAEQRALVEALAREQGIDPAEATVDVDRAEAGADVDRGDDPNAGRADPSDRPRGW